MNLSKFLLVVLIAVTIAGCSKTESDKTPVARIDNQTLLLEEICAHIDTSREPTQAQIQQYIQRWLTEESLYREAVDHGLDRTEETNQKVEDARRQLAINALLEKEVYSQQTSDFSSEELRQYYNEHIKEFNLMHDVALVSYVLFKNRDAATEFRNLVLKGTPWSSAVVKNAASIFLRVDSSYQTQATFMPAELWRVAIRSANRELSFPINTKNGYYILVVWKIVKQGQKADLPLVEQEIRGRLTVERRRLLYNQLVQKLRAKHAIEVFVTSSTGADVNNPVYDDSSGREGIKPIITKVDSNVTVVKSGEAQKQLKSADSAVPKKVEVVKVDTVDSKSLNDKVSGAIDPSTVSDSAKSKLVK